MRSLLIPLILLFVPLSAAFAADDQPDDEGPTIEEQLTQLRALADSVVNVEYTLRYDNGEPPRDDFHGDELIAQERPLEVYSYLIAPDLVLSQDLAVHERFVQKIEVRFKDDAVPAKPVAWAKRNHGVYLKLERPLKGAKPLRFDPTLQGPYTAVTAGNGPDGTTGLFQADFTPQPVLTQELGEYITMPDEAVIVDPEGKPVGMSMSTYLTVNQAWKRTPAEWEQITAEQRKALLDKVRNAADRGIVRVALNFRSPKTQADPFAPNRMRGGEAGDEEAVTEQHLPAILLEDGRLIVPAPLKPSATARLDHITVHPVQGEPVTATFVGSLKDYGAFIAKLDRPIPNSGIKLSNQPIFAFHNRLIPQANIEVRGEERLIYLNHRRLQTYTRGWHNHAYPQITDDRGDIFLFDENGTLIAFPFQHRQKLTAAPQDPTNPQPSSITPTAYLFDVLAHLEANLDSSNVPLSEQEENRVAWLGLVLQPLDRELARANKVAEQTQDGATGGLVNFVYPGSPAAKSGVEPGWVLVRLHVQGYPQPADVHIDERAAGFPLPWEQLDEVPEQYFERIPPPWPNAENSLTEMLTEIGFGTPFTAEFYNNGQKILKEFKIEKSPPHYNSATRQHDDNLGVTVRDLTYEVRQYFQLAGDAPGVIVSKVEPGSRASVAGIKPYELVTQVNGQPIKTVQDFAKTAEGATELRLTLQRMTRTRQVPIRLDTPKPKPPAKPALPEVPEK